MAAAFDLLWFLTLKQAESAAVDQLVLISGIREHVLPAVYSEAYPVPGDDA